MTTDRTGAIAVTKRLNEIEQQNRWLRLALIAIASAIGAVFLTAAMPSTKQTVTAQQFVLVDGSGNQRAILAVDKDGQSSFALYDASGQRRLVLGSVVLYFPTGGGTAITPVDSITGFDENGNIRGRWPQ